VYSKQVNVNVVVPMTLGEWSRNQTVRGALVAAVAEAGGVGPGSVAIESATPIVAGGGGAGARRLMGMAPMMRTLPGTEVRLVARGAERLKGLEQRLRTGAHPALRRAQARWQRAHQIRVARAK
jgi:hypothetical protein